MLRLGDSETFVELDLTRLVTEALPSKGDGEITVHVCSAGFIGRNSVWIEGGMLQSFCRAVLTLEQTRQGEALLKSIGPDELLLRLRSIDSLGHMAVEGSTGRHVFRGKIKSWHALEFAFEFDPTQLAELAQIDWVRRAAQGASS